ncbi:MAG: hypothetical protein RLP27_12515, partial [Rhodospirillales bacterium]
MKSHIFLSGTLCRSGTGTPILGRFTPASTGPNLRAFVLYLRFGQAIPFERLARLLGDLFGLAISE